MFQALRTPILTLVILLLVSSACTVIPGRPAAPATPPPGVPAELSTVWEAWQVLNQEYVQREALEPKKMSKGAIQGFIQALGDPYTSYIDAQQFELERGAFRGSYEGIGAHVAIREGQLIVVAPISGSPAEKGGVRPGDRIMAVDGVSTAGMSVAEAVLKIRGPQGSPVKLLILHPGQEKAVELVIVRAKIQVASVRHKSLPDNIAHIILSYYSESTNHELRPVLEELGRQGAAGIILDLRNNPGGLLDVAVEVASQFMDQGVVVYEVNSKGERRPWAARPGGLALQGRLAVLVNGASASGSEVVAGALQDSSRAVLIGTKTFGKGSINTFRELSDGSALYITIARWMTPKGRLIEGQGLIPDIEVPFTEADREKGLDPQLERALQYIKTGS